MFPQTKYYMSQEETSCHRNKLPVTGRNFLSKKEASCHNKKPSVTIRNFLSQEETSCYRKKHLKIDIQMYKHNAEAEVEMAENVPLLKNGKERKKENPERNTICHRKKLPVTEKKLPVTGRN
jgi:hypothetical protein